MPGNKIPIFIISFILLINISFSNQVSAKVVHLNAKKGLVKALVKPVKSAKKQVQKKQKKKGKRRRAIGMLVGGGAFILLGLIAIILGVLSYGTSSILIYVLIGLGALIGGILLIMKGDFNLKKLSKREENKNSNQGKVMYD